MIKLYNPILVLCVTILGMSCSSTIQINEYIDSTKPMILTVSDYAQTNGLTNTAQYEIASGSEVFKKLLEWNDKNSDGWEQSIASHIAEVSITQGNFRLLYNPKGFAIIGFIDNESRSKQYAKSVPEGELDFLREGIR